MDLSTLLKSPDLFLHVGEICVNHFHFRLPQYTFKWNSVLGTAAPKTTFIKKPLSSKANFIKDHSHQKHFHQTTLIRKTRIHGGIADRMVQHMGTDSSRVEADVREEGEPRRR